MISLGISDAVSKGVHHEQDAESMQADQTERETEREREQKGSARGKERGKGDLKWVGKPFDLRGIP